MDSPMLDTLYHHELALKIIYGKLLGTSTFKAPLYPYFLALLYKIFSPDFLVVRIVQFFLGAVLTFPVFFLGKRLFDEKTGFWAALIYAVYPMFFYFEGELLVEPLFVFLSVMFLLTMSSFVDNIPGRKISFCGGFFLGLASITRPNVLTVLPFFGFWLWRRTRKLAVILLFLGGIGLCIIPVSIRNYILTKDLIFISSQGGINFFIGNNSKSDGWSTRLPGVGAWLNKDIPDITRKFSGKDMSPGEISDYWFSKAVNFILDNPLSFLRKLFRKVCLFWTPVEIRNNRGIYFFTRYSSLLGMLVRKGVICFPFGILFPLAILGVWHSFSKRRKSAYFLLLYILPFFGGVAMFFVCSRFRISVILPLILFATYGCRCFIDDARNRKIKKVALTFSLLISFFLICNWGYCGARKIEGYYEDLNSLGLAKAAAGNYQEGMDYFLEAVRLKPDFAVAYNNLGNSFGVAGKLDMAERYFRKAIHYDSDMVLAWVNLGKLYQMKENPEKAQEAFKKALDIVPDSRDALFSFAVLYHEYGRMDEALFFYLKILERNPDDVETLSNIVALKIEKKEIKKAEIFLKRALNSPVSKEIKNKIRKHYKFGGWF